MTKAGLPVEKSEEAGLWWLPESPDSQVAGILRVDEVGRQELQLIGSFRDPWHGAEVKQHPDGSTERRITSSAIEQQGLYPRIHGVVGANAITLDDCFQVASTSNLFGGIGSERIHVHQSFTNAHFEQGEEIAFVRARVAMVGLAHWVMKTGLQESMMFEQDSEGSAKNITHKIDISNVPNIEFLSPEGHSLAFTHEYTIGGDRRTELQFTQDFRFLMTTDTLIPREAFMEVASHLQDLLTVAIARPAAFTEVSFRHPEIVREMGEKKHYPEIVTTAQWSVRPSAQKALSESDVIFTLDDFGGTAQVTKWLECAATNRSALSRVMATKYSPGMYVGDAFFNCAAALEAFDREKHVDSRSYVRRLKRCATFAGPEFASLVGDVGEWAELVKTNRNTVAHHNAEIADASTEQIVLGQSAFWLFIFCLLREIDTPDVIFAKISEQQFFARLGRDVAQLLARPSHPSYF